jgi:hypothetical protein
MVYHVVRYEGEFGFIKPWTAVRDGETFSQQFLTPSIIEGIRQKLEVESILRHKLLYHGISVQQETVRARAFGKRAKGKLGLETSILKRGVMIHPCLYLAFSKKADGEKASREHICLCRNEDLLLPKGGCLTMKEEEFDKLKGFELRFGMTDKSFMVGYNRFDDNKPMYGWIEITGKPTAETNDEV